MPHDATQAAPPSPIPDTTLRPIAPWLHTIALFALLLLSTFFTRQRAATRNLASIRHIPSYLGSIGLEWLLLALVLTGIYRKRDFLLGAFRSRAHTLQQTVGFGVVVYLLGFVAIAITGVVLFLTHLLPRPNEAIVLAMAPHTLLELAVWFAVSLTAGICEEIIFRGYLLQQFNAWTRRPVLAIILTALLFGSVHLYEGLGAILPLAALGLVYGYAVHHLKGDLRAVIIAHTLQDFIVALIVLARPTLERYQQTT